jgi:hypothetical protein
VTLPVFRPAPPRGPLPASSRTPPSSMGEKKKPNAYNTAYGCGFTIPLSG